MASRASESEDDFTRLTAALMREVNARKSAFITEQLWDRTEDALTYFNALDRKFPDLVEAFGDMIALIVPRILLDKEQIRAAVQDGFAVRSEAETAKLDFARAILLRELSSLATVFVSGDTAVYKSICNGITDLMSFPVVTRRDAPPVSGRRRPPTTAAPPKALADNKEYYL
jgi:hypothetical protein